MGYYLTTDQRTVVDAWLNREDFESYTALEKYRWAAIDITSLAAGMANIDDNAIPKSGATLTGFLTLHAAPTSNFHPATKKYVDDAIALTEKTANKNQANGYLGLDGSSKIPLGAVSEVLSLSNLTDVTPLTPSPGEVLIYQTGGWITSDLPGAVEASETEAGIVSIGTQSFAGAKTFTNRVYTGRLSITGLDLDNLDNGYFNSGVYKELKGDESDNVEAPFNTSPYANFVSELILNPIEDELNRGSEVNSALFLLRTSPGNTGELPLMAPFAVYLQEVSDVETSNMVGFKVLAQKSGSSDEVRAVGSLISTIVETTGYDIQAKGIETWVFVGGPDDGNPLAYGIHVNGLGISHPGTGGAYGLKIEPISNFAENYAIYTDSGIVRLGDDIHIFNGKSIRFLKDSTEVPYIEFVQPESFSENVRYILPETAPTVGQFLKVDNFSAPDATLAWTDVDTGGGGDGSTFTIYDQDKPPTSPSAQNDEFEGITLNPMWNTSNPGSQLNVSIVDDMVKLHCTAPGSDGDNIRGIYQPVPSGDWTVVTKMSISRPSPVFGMTNIFAAGIAIFEDAATTSGKLHTNMMVYEASCYIGNARYNNYTSHNSYVAQYPVAEGGNTYYLKIVKSGTTYLHYWSENGRNWNQNGSSTLSFTPLHLGIFVDNWAVVNGTTDTYFDFFRVYTTDPGYIGGQREISAP